jgi:peptidoglycan hydrolase CwlO-like protein
MKKYWLLSVLLLLLSGSSGLYADVILTDEQAAELDQTLDELATISEKQKTRISDLEMRNSELENQLNELEKQAQERQNLLTEQEKTIKEAKSLYRKQNLFSVLRNVLISIGVGLLGFAIGILLF